jgi:hypothetical protein
MLKLTIYRLQEANGIHFSDSSRKSVVNVDTNKKTVLLDRSGPFVKVVIAHKDKEKHIKCERLDVEVIPTKDSDVDEG